MGRCGWMYRFAHRVTTKITTVFRAPTVSTKRGSVMKLTREQSQKLLHERGIWITNACNKCGQLLGAVRWTLRSEPGEWCSLACRDGIKVERQTCASAALITARKESQRRIGSRRSGRPRTHATNAEKQRSYRGRLKNRLALRNTPSEQIESTRLADTKNGSHVVQPSRAIEGLETAPRIEFLSGSLTENLPKESF
jgi:hypothetical protein